MNVEFVAVVLAESWQCEADDGQGQVQLWDKIRALENREQDQSCEVSENQGTRVLGFEPRVHNLLWFGIFKGVTNETIKFET